VLVELGSGGVAKPLLPTDIPAQSGALVRERAG